MTDKIVFLDGSVFDATSVVSCTYTEQVNSETDICPGAACSAEVEIKLRANYGAITQGTQFTYYKVDSTGVETKIGVFTAEKPEKTSPYTYTVLAYDNISKTYKDASGWLRDNQGKFPMSLLSLVQTACSECGLTLANTDFPNSDFQVQAFYADELQWVQILQWAAQAACRFVRCNSLGQIEFAWYTQAAGASISDSRDEVQAAIRLAGDVLRTAQGLIYSFAKSVDGYAADGLTFEEYETATLDKVQIKQSDDDVGVIYPPDETKTNTYIIQGNMLLAPISADALEPVARAVYETLSQVKYTPGSVTLFPTLSYRAGSIVGVYPQSGDVIRLYVTSAVFSDAGVQITSTGNASRDSSTAVNNRKYSNLSGKLLEISASVDGLKITASDLSGGLASLELSVDGLRTEVSGKLDDTEASTMIQQSLSQLSLSASAGDQSSTLTLKAGETTLSSAKITFEGMVTFKALSGSGTAVINGDNITAGTLGSAAGNTEYNLDAGTIRTGRSNSNRVQINDRGITWYVENAGQSYLTGVLYSKYGATYIGDNSRYTFLGWFSSATPNFSWSSGGAHSNFVGIAIDQTGATIHCNASKFEIPGRIECSSLAVNGREI